MRAYGEGSLRKARGKWQGILRYKGADGKWHTETKLFPIESDAKTNKGRREAKKALSEWRSTRIEESATENEESGQTVGSYVDGYIQSRTSFVERSTLSEYKRLAGYLRHGRGVAEVRLSELEPDAVQQWVNDMSEDYKPVTVRKAFTLLRSAMTQAVERDVLVKNPTRTVRPPKMPTPKPNSLTERQRGALLAFMDIADPSAYTLGIKMALFTGMRESEICGLRWCNVDIAGRRLLVRDVVGCADGKEYIKEPKTGGSRREIYFGEQLAQALERRREDMAAECDRAGIPMRPDMFVLGAPDGSWMPRHRLWKRWNDYARVLDLVGTQGKRPTFHDLRHSYATTAITSGVDVKTVSSSMGHANAAMTLNIYASADPDAKRRAADAVERAMAGERDKEQGR